MSGWTEATLRAAASWQAFKEGKSLFEAGAVSETKAGQGAWTGTVKSGTRPFKVRVLVKSATDIEARCSCPENRRSGAICAHAVASGLAALSGTNTKAPARPTPKSSPAETIPATWQILFPLNWREALARGKFAATLATASGSEPSAADFRLTEWLQAEKVAAKSILSLNLDGGRVSDFLGAIANHPRLVAGKDRVSISIRAGERIHLESATLHGDLVRMVPAADSGKWIEIDGCYWQITADSVIRAGEGSIPAELAAAMREISRGNAVDIPTDRFFNQLETWQEWVVFPDNGWLDQLHFVPASAAILLTLEGSLTHLDATVQVKYGSAPAVSPGVGKVDGLPRLLDDRCEIRNQAAEERAVNRLMNAGFQAEDYASGRWSLRGEDSVLGFLTGTLPTLRKQWTVTEGERFVHVQKQVAVVSPKIEFGSSGEDWLSFDLKFQTTDGTNVPVDEIRRLLRSGRSSGRTASGRHLIISNDVEDIIDPLFSELDLHQENGRFTASPAAGELIREIQNKLNNSSITNDQAVSFSFDYAASFQAELRPYQSAGSGWMLDRVERFGGALLADDMGLGKTIQTIAVIERLFESEMDDSGVVLVLATTSLLGNWKAEFGKFAPTRTVHILHGTGRDSLRAKIGSGDVVLTSYGTLARDLAWHLKREYRAVVVDEASLLRNPDTDHAKAVAKLRASHRLALTGTPIENSVRDLWSIFRFIQPGWLGSRQEFKDRYEAPLAAGEGAAAVMERLRLKTTPFLLRRTKEQVAPDLPSKLFIDEFCDLSADQQAVYKTLLEEGRKRVEAIGDSGNQGAARMQMLTALLRLRQTCCDLALLGNDRFNKLQVPRRSTKIERLLELLEEAVSGGHRILVFSQFQKQLLEIEKCLQAVEIANLRLDGQTRNRQQLVDKFQSPDGPPVFLISLKAGGYGLNLTAADIVIHFDPWWNPAAEMQATDRAHRIGQTRPVTVYRLLTRGTVEEKVVRLQAKKRELAAAIDETGAGDAPGWTIEDMKSVISG